MVQLDDSDYTVLEDIDLNLVPAVSIAHTVGYFNQTMSLFVRHLNQFSLSADEKLRQISSGITRVETELSILEAKLAGIPGLESSAVNQSSTASPAVVSSQSVNNSATAAKDSFVPTISTAESQPSQRSPSVTTAIVPEAVPAPITTPVSTVQQDPVYSIYFKMLKMGVPAQAVKLKMISEKANPDYLDTPDAPYDSLPQMQSRKEESGTDSDSSD